MSSAMKWILGLGAAYLLLRPKPAPAVQPAGPARPGTYDVPGSAAELPTGPALNYDVPLPAPDDILT